MKVGLISDTHNHLDPRIPALFTGVDHILHAGDIGLPWLIAQLEVIAPVTAVVGNTDTALALKETEIVQLGGCKFLIHHIVDVRSPAGLIRQRIALEEPDVVVFGHTHKPCSERIGGTLYINPGYAGRPRFGLARSLAVLDCDDNDIQVKFLSLETGRS